MKANLSPAAYYQHAQRNSELSWGLDWAEYQAFGRKVDMDERVCKMKGDRIAQIELSAYKQSLTDNDKAKFWELHNLMEREQASKDKHEKPS